MPKELLRGMASEGCGPTSAELLDLAEAIGHPISGATLSHWRRRGLLPKTRRKRGGRSASVHPIGTDQQLRRLLYWRERSPRLAPCGVALWVEGFPIRSSVVRGALLEFVVTWAQEAEETLPVGSEPGAAIDAMAAELARRRSKAPVPRLSRMRLAERERAYGYILSVMLGAEEEAIGRIGDLTHVQRLFGLRRGHGGGLAGEFDLSVVDGFGSRVRAPAIRQTIVKARAVELEYVRRVVHLNVNWMARLVEALFAEEAVKALDIRTLAREWLAEPPAESMALMAIDFLATLDERAPDEADLRTAIQALSPSAVAEEFDSMLAELEGRKDGQSSEGG